MYFGHLLFPFVWFLSCFPSQCVLTRQLEHAISILLKQMTLCHQPSQHVVIGPSNTFSYICHAATLNQHGCGSMVLSAYDQAKLIENNIEVFRLGVRGWVANNRVVQFACGWAFVPPDFFDGSLGSLNLG